MNIQLFLILITLIYSNASFSVIDLGDLEIEGEIRRPMIHYIGSPKGKKDSMYRFIEEEFHLSFATILNMPVLPNRQIQQHQSQRDHLISELLK